MSDTAVSARFWQLDRLTIGLLGLVCALFLTALVTTLVNRNSTGPEAEPTYRTENSPEAVVHNAYLALHRNEMDEYEKLITTELKEELGSEPGMLTHGYYPPSPFGLKVVDSEIEDGTATVTIATYRTDAHGFLGLRRVHVDQWHVTVEQVDGQWKLDERLLMN